ncbi:MAG: acetyl-CoA carboxylase biotin carboxyl carrier protein subunit [Clostridiales bacterium]|nr:MAG: acetyl-CoA carboxylase biotin carboxyl carrier protein subunit [Clostridiales bacterium]
MEKYTIRVNGVEYEVEVEKRSEAGDTGIDMTESRESRHDVRKNIGEKESQPQNGSKVTAGTAGKVWKIVASEGDNIKRGDSILVLESMKMEIPVVAPCDGRVNRLFVREGDSVDMGQEIAVVA